MRTLRSWNALFLLLTMAAGCGQPVREDRTIAWSAAGTAVGFQHGADGVFLADPGSGERTRIFKPDPDVLATSTPIWAPTGQQAIFTSARSADPRSPLAVGLDVPEGKITFQHPIVYTCWLHDARNRKDAKPMALFEACCDHVGYVAGNLAVRWHPRGDRIYFLKQVAPNLHRLHEFDVRTRQERDVSPVSAPAMIFDFSPDGRYIACMAGSPKRGASDGLWIGRVDGDHWWEVPASGAFRPGELPSLIEQLREAQPIWSADGKRFAFVTYYPPMKPDGVGEYLLREGTPATAALRVLARGPVPYRQLHWSPEGNLGVIVGYQLCIIDTGEVPTLAHSIPAVRRFAGWDSRGKHFAYTAAEPEMNTRPHWAFLFVPDPFARDAVVVAPDGEATDGEVVLSGMQVTFPHWSPKEQKLSLWLTFAPKYRWQFGGRLRPGDPAAVFDVKTRKLTWLAVNAHEKAQVGHYYLLKRKYAEAARWYADAERAEEAAPAPPITVVRLGATEDKDFAFFHYYCLKKLGRAHDAASRLAEFRKSAALSNGNAVDGQSPRALELTGLLNSFLIAAYQAEVFLSLDAVEDGEVFLREELRSATTDHERLSRSVVLGQMLLLGGKYPEYAELMMVTALPLLVDAVKALPASDFFTETVASTGMLALLPLASREFLASLPEDTLRLGMPRLKMLRASTSDSVAENIDRVLYAIYRRLGMETERSTLAATLKGKGTFDEDADFWPKDLAFPTRSGSQNDRRR
jgi:hypothetical protein